MFSSGTTRTGMLSFGITRVLCVAARDESPLLGGVWGGGCEGLLGFHGDYKGWGVSAVQLQILYAAAGLSSPVAPFLSIPIASSCCLLPISKHIDLAPQNHAAESARSRQHPSASHTRLRG
jgi:hypothetical protein